MNTCIECNRFLPDHSPLCSRPANHSKDVAVGERGRIADLIEQNAKTILAFAATPERALDLLVYLLRLDQPSAAGTQGAETA
jgi:hypothetical protein